MIAIATSCAEGARLDRRDRIALSAESGFFVFGLVAVGQSLTPGLAAAGDGLQVPNARVPASDEVGIDLPLVMTIRNDAIEADAILRVRCPFANFAVKHKVDRGEGAPAMREIKSIPLPESKTIELKQDGYHVMLLQTRQKLVEGETFTCAVVSRKPEPKKRRCRFHERPDRKADRRVR
jgi:copper(I)-binding protein